MKLLEWLRRAFHPGRDFSPAHATRTMNLSILEGGFSMLFINWTQGSVLTGYALYLGATPFELGLIAMSRTISSKTIGASLVLS